MKKLFITGAIAVLAFSSVAHAELELSGNVTAMTVYQHDNKNGGANGSIAGGLTQGDFGGGFVAAGNADHFAFVVDQAEIDVENEFGENIMARIDLDAIENAAGTTSLAGGSNLFLEQAYVTANLAIGNGMEWLIGKFNAPLGLESVDRHENVFSTYTPGWVFLTPKQVVGAKIYYEFNDNWNFDLGVVNQLNNVNAFDVTNSDIPSGFLRIGAQWGDFDRLSFINVGGGIGPEYTTGTSGTGTAPNSKLDYYAALWGNFAFGDYWDLGWEGLFRMSDNPVAGATNRKAYAGQLYVVYTPSDVWTVQVRGSIFVEPDTNGTASTTGGFWNGATVARSTTYNGSLGATYKITDDAKLKLEYRFDLENNKAGVADGNHHTGVAEFAYSF